MIQIEKILKNIELVSMYEPRKSIREMYIRTARNIIKFLENEKPLAMADCNDGFSVVITQQRQILFLYKNKIAPAGMWVDKPEKHWGMSYKEYALLPLRDRAILECEEQCNKWIRKEFRQAYNDFWKLKDLMYRYKAYKYQT